VKVVEMLRRGAILVPLDGLDLKGALTTSLRAVSGVSNEAVEKLAADLVAGASGEICRIHERVVVALAESVDVDEISAVIGVSPVGFTRDETDAAAIVGGVGAPGGDPDSEALLLILTPSRLVSMGNQMLPTLRRFFQEEASVAPILNARSSADVESVAVFMDLDPHRSFLVEDMVEPLQYRVYPDTPYSEVVDLMVRRDLQAVPVVGEDYEFLGVVTTGTALDELVSRTRAEGVGGGHAAVRGEPTAREVMTRTVMCVSEDQNLIEAASIMVNRGVEQLPVIRDGEMVGFLTRGEVLRWLFSSTSLEYEESPFQEE